ncbi:TIGR04222 domain-containing membrane protein [Nonomuraea deserti]|uniref:TIGR04222 domain-containing membrane protein n=1 Tax=Nonomuraea deserti TaxID=1848322 RepID=A0A4R4UMP8_9ACTN|nr:TIGR04222 domain-containing membrane protein [Nonomuraea deserti]TDC91556.1 TIGR04222 domain-containing membrane protein [Nonomuraea deserti]
MDLFLLILSVALPAVAVATAFSIKGERAAGRESPAVSGALDLDHYDLAYLAGGSAQVAGTAVALLAGSGDLRVSRGGHVHSVHAPSVSRHPIEQETLAKVATVSGLQASALKRRVGESLAMDALRRNLTERGLVLPGHRVRRLGRLATRLRAVSALAVTGAVVCLVTTPALLPLLLLAGTGIGAAVVARDHRGSRRGTLTAEGAERLDQARAGHPRGTGDGPVHVALYGPAESPDPRLRAELGAMRSPRRSSRRATYRGTGGAGSCAGGGCGGASHGGSGCGGGAGCGSGCGGGS